MTLGVISALPFEARCLIGGRVEPDTVVRVDDTLLLVQCGIGRANAARAAQRLIDAGATLLLSWGIAGGLDLLVGAGTLVLPLRILATDGRALPVDPDSHADLYRHLDGRLQASTGTLVEGDRMLYRPADKLSLFEGTGAVAVDMESAAVAETACRAGIRFLAARAILDPASTSLPANVVASLDAHARLLPRRLVTALLCHVDELPSVLRLAWRSRLARVTLNRAAAAVRAMARAGGADPHAARLSQDNAL